MTNDTKLVRLPFGCNKGLPGNVRIAWGARMIAPADLVWDRQGCAGGEEGGEERALLLDWLSERAGDAARQFCRDNQMGISNGSSEEIFTLYEDERGKVVGSPQGSHGHVYIAAWLKVHED